MSYGSWAVVIDGANRNATEVSEVRDKARGVYGVYSRPGETPVFNGSLDEWATSWKAPFEVYPDGAYIKI